MRSRIVAACILMCMGSLLVVSVEAKKEKSSRRGLPSVVSWAPERCAPLPGPPVILGGQGGSGTRLVSVPAARRPQRPLYHASSAPLKRGF